MTIANSSQARVAYVAESTVGTTPSTPSFKTLGVTSSSLALTKSALESAEIRSDRQVHDVRHGTRSIAGDVAIEVADNDLDDLLEGLLGSTWSADVLKVGSTRKSFTFEHYFSDAGQYERFAGCHVNSMSLSVAPDSIVTATLGIVGMTFTDDTSAIAGATYNATSSTIPFDGNTGIGLIEEGGGATALVTAIELTIENGVEPRFVVGSANSLAPKIGQCKVSGTISVYFEDRTILDKFVDETASTLQFTLSDGTNTLDFLLPNIKYMEGAPNISGEDDIVLSMPFTALYDATEASTITITRA